MERHMTDTVKVSPDIRKVNSYLRRAKQVAVSSIHPIYVKEEGKRVLSAFNMDLEGPAKHLSYLNRLLDDANLKIG